MFRGLVGGFAVRPTECRTTFYFEIIKLGRQRTMKEIVYCHNSSLYLILGISVDVLAVYRG